MKKKNEPTTVVGEAWTCYPPSAFVLDTVTLRRNGVATTETVRKMERTIYPNGNVVTVLELA